MDKGVKQIIREIELPNIQHNLNNASKHIIYYPTTSESEGFIITSLGKYELDGLNKVVDEIMDTNFNGLEDRRDTLVGNIDKEFELPVEGKEIIQPFIGDLAKIHQKSFSTVDSLLNTSTHGLKYQFNTSDIWVNFQQKHDFNPVHNHSGALSWVCWLRMPFYTEEEIKMYPEAPTKASSKFSFVYPDNLGGVAQQYIPVDKNWEGVICMFPSRLNHTVYPFHTSDDYRVTIAGNISLSYSFA
jgi:hypothetical protein